MSTLPHTLQIGPFVYTVYADLEKIKDAEKESGSLFGVTTVGDLEILLHPTSHDLVQRETLLHEVLHAVFHNVGLSEKLGDKAEEQMIRSLSPALFDLLLRNPQLVAYLVGAQ
jgi:hypothetical protein